MTINNTGQPGPHSPRLAPLQHPPHRIRPPFHIAHHDTVADRRKGETTHQWRARSHADRVTALLEPLDGLELGAHDRRILDWLANEDTPTLATIASLLHRTRTLGATDHTQDNTQTGAQPSAQAGAPEGGMGGAQDRAQASAPDRAR